MRIYNGTNARISLPYPGKRVEVGAHSVSGDIGANTEVISLLVTGYGVEEVAIIVSGPYELNLCSSIPTVTSYVVQSIEEAIERFTPKNAEVKKEVKKEATKKVVEAPKVEKVVEKVEEPKPSEEKFKEGIGKSEVLEEDLGEAPFPDCCEVDEQEQPCELSKEEASGEMPVEEKIGEHLVEKRIDAKPFNGKFKKH